MEGKTQGTRASCVVFKLSSNSGSTKAVLSTPAEVVAVRTTTATSISTIQDEQNLFIANGVNPSAILPSGSFRGCSFTFNININKWLLALAAISFDFVFLKSSFPPNRGTTERSFWPLSACLKLWHEINKVRLKCLSRDYLLVCHTRHIAHVLEAYWEIKQQILKCWLVISLLLSFKIILKQRFASGSVNIVE